MPIRFPPATAALVAAAALAAGCSSERLSNPGPRAAAPLSTGSIRPPVEMAGRWVLTSPGRGQCHVTVGVAPGSSGGTLAPEGGCPGHFYMGRQWAFEGTALVLRDHNGQPLGHLSHAGGARFDGRTIAGEPITLSR